MNQIYLVPLLPLIGAAINGALSFLGKGKDRRIVHAIGCGTIFISFIVALGAFINLSMLPAEERSVTVELFKWISMPLLKADCAFLVDPLSSVMMLVVTGVGLLIHIYSIGYMRHDPGYARFFSYFNLFCFAMLVLVLADNLLLMFVGWEGVGLCSYLLIGFWFDHKPNAVAGMKAFVVNRIGDFGFLIGLFILFWAMWKAGHPTITFVGLKENVYLLEGMRVGPFAVATLAGLLLFVGAAGKSAQLPLYVWLPDAMAGPTPVSALIHAATMVTAGVYMIGRMNFLYTIAPDALLVVAFVGATTALFAAAIGFAQNDIKKVLAYSTVSQLGYMFMGMGSGIYSTGIFHLVTHAFFKACLFLGAGSVILGMHHEQNIQKMGGLKKYMPVTYLTFLVATLALAGIFPLSGFFSKDEILWQEFAHGSMKTAYYAVWAMGVVGALATAFYMMRLVALTFFGELRAGHDLAMREEDALDDGHRVDNLHQPRVPYESPRVITYVLVALAVLSAVGGLMGVPQVLGKHLGLPNYFEAWLAPVFESAAKEAEGAASHGSSIEYALMALSVGVALAGLALAYWLYTRRKDIVDALTARFTLTYKVVANKFYVDELYNRVFVQSLLKLNGFLKRFDDKVVDGLVNLTGRTGVVWARISGWLDEVFVDGAVNLVSQSTITAGRRIKKIQTGRIQHYFYIALCGIIIMLAWHLLGR